MGELPSGPVTFLFTDIEGSTRRWQDEPEAMQALLLEHDAILRDVIEKCHGFLLKHTGDGIAAERGHASGGTYYGREVRRSPLERLGRGPQALRVPLVDRRLDVCQPSWTVLQEQPYDVSPAGLISTQSSQERDLIHRLRHA